MHLPLHHRQRQNRPTRLTLIIHDIGRRQRQQSYLGRAPIHHRIVPLVKAVHNPQRGRADIHEAKRQGIRVRTPISIEEIEKDESRQNGDGDGGIRKIRNDLGIHVESLMCPRVYVAISIPFFHRTCTCNKSISNNCRECRVSAKTPRKIETFAAPPAEPQSSREHILLTPFSPILPKMSATATTAARRVTRLSAAIEAGLVSPKPAPTPKTPRPRVVDPLGVKIPFEELEAGKRYIAKYTGPKIFSTYPGCLLAGEFIKSEYVAGPSGKPYVVLKATKYVAGRLMSNSAFKIREKDGELYDLLLMPTAGYISSKYPDRELYLRSNKWVFYAEAPDA